jgi:hypothetical protein
LSEPSSTKQETHTIDLFRDNIKNLLSHVNPALARGYFDDKMTNIQLLAFAHARAAVEYIMNQSAKDTIQTKISIREGQLDAVFQRILKNVLKSYEIGVYDMSNVSTSIPSVQRENELKRATGEVSFHDWLADRILEQNENIPREEIEKVYRYLSED